MVACLNANMAFANMAFSTGAKSAQGAKSAKCEAEPLQVTAEDIAIPDAGLEKMLVKSIKEKGTLTASSQGIDSYMIAVLCEYPEPKSASGEPSCTFRKIKKNSK